MPDTAMPWTEAALSLGPQLADGVDERDRDDTFVAENFQLLKEHRFFSALVPTELNGGGAHYGDMCDALREMAHSCSSTALALSMHQHLTAAQVWNHRHGRPAPVLQRIGDAELVLISTGAYDWLASNGSAEKVDGGFRVTARKAFASGSPSGDILITSAVYDDPAAGESVLHFPVPLTSEGVRIEQDWHVMGMRATGSNTVVLDNVFVPDASVALLRPRSGLHPIFNLVAAVALPLVMGVYVGVAEAAAALAREHAAGRADDPTVQILLGEMENELTTAQLAWRDMVALANDFDCEPSVALTNDVVIRKTIVSRAVLQTAEKALEAVGGKGFFRPLGLERLVRDAHAAQFHPLQEKRQLVFTGRVSLGLDPIEG